MGGRIAIYSFSGSGLPLGHVTALKGGGGAEDGTVNYGTQPTYLLLQPAHLYLQGTESIAWDSLAADPATTVDVQGLYAGQAVSICQSAPADGACAWDTSALPNGHYDLRLTFHTPSAGTTYQLDADRMINSGVTPACRAAGIG